MLDGVISQVEYKLFKEDFRRKIEDTERNITYLKGEIGRLSDDGKTRELVERFKTQGNISELDRRAAVTLIHSIIVYNSKDIKIRFRYAGGLDFSDEYINSRSIPEGMVI